MARAIDPLKQALARIEARQNAKPKTPLVVAQDAAPAKVVQLPLWGEDRRGVPNDLVRSALFTVGNKSQKRTYLKEAVIAALGEVQITYTGEELRQDDEDVFLQILHLSRTVPLGQHIDFTAYSLLQALGWTTDGRAYDRLKRSLVRLKATSLSVSNATRGYAGSLIRSFEWQNQDNEQGRMWRICLESKIIALFGHTTYSQIIWDQRQRLGPLAKWLHSFYFTHADPFPMKTQTLRTLCGSVVKDLFKFRQNIKSALQELVDVGFLVSWEIDRNDNVHVERVPKLALR
jgi:hypothetical protein